MCLVERPLQVKVHYETLRGEKISTLFMGLTARIFMHEVDHLDGELMWHENKRSLTPRRLERQLSIVEIEKDP